ncbi:DEAD/DEAH box helicase [Pseudomonas syringae]|uniref:DEAD/DEAH box helicase n=1 Tax=Pseudomonas syringae TaxID=317 RepID=UPI000E30B977|nr:DEAD/DEAH box helicase family protein [Pseudomonas syringae]
MSKKLIDHLARCHFDALKPILGDATITLLQKVGNATLNPESLAFLVVSVLGEEGALRSAEVRELLFSKLEVEEGRALCELLQLPTSAALLTLSGTNFDVNPSNLEILTRWFNVTYEATDLASHATEGSRKTIASHKLRSHQLTAFRKLRSVISTPSANALIHMPYGAGKLRLVATAVLDLYRSEPEGQVIVWLTPGQALCEEAFSEVRTVWEQLGSHDITIYRAYGNRKIPDLGSLKNCIIIADIAKIDCIANAEGGEAELIKLGEKSRVLVLGDAAHAGHLAGIKILEMMEKTPTFSLVGISASPGVTIMKDSSSGELNIRFSKAYITIDDDDPIRLLRDAGDVSEVEIEVFPVTWDSTLTIDEDALEFSVERLDLISKNVERNHALLELLLNEASKTKGDIVFYTVTADHARLFAGLLAFRGTQAASVTSDSSPEERDREIKRFNARTAKILCVHGFLISGDSVPKMSVAVVACPTLSESVYHGMIGRLANLRKVGESQLKIVVVADSIPRRAYAHEVLESWNKLDLSEL